MRHLPQNISLLVVSILMVSAVAVAPVYARDGTSSSGSDSSSNVATPDDGTATGGGRSNSTGTPGVSTNFKQSDSSNGTETENETGTESEHTTLVKASSGDLQNLHDQALKLLQQKRQGENNGGKTVEQRQQACNAHKTELTTRAEDYAHNAGSHLDVFNGIYTKVLAFQAAKNLNAPNFDSLKSAADAKQAAAESAVAALSDPSVTTIDCTTQDPASTVAALKTAVTNARTALQDYRTAIKNVVVALENAKTGTSANPGTGSNQ